jgi:rhamnopyranosyl-N-acetylglucosaminyl-diphospho-decaprenol beta-1,3/1,4-galactofuranosyltransferase
MPNTCAVIVTFNRKETLAVCLRSILDGELVPEKLLVVDNASTDGTPEFVQTHFPDASVLRLPRNMGGAGGFKAGMAEALRLGYEFMWVMDDDHVVEKQTFRELMDAMRVSGKGVVGPVILAPSHDGKLSWPMGPGGQGYLTYESIVRDYGANGYIPQNPAPFNAVLYRRSAVEQLGLPDERLFIRGDEMEYSFRIDRQRVGAIVSVRAHVYHPMATNEYYDVLTVGKTRLTACYTGNRLKDYCLFRNRAFYFKKYGQYKSLLLDPPRYLLFFLRNRKFDFAGLRFWFKAYLDGLLGNFGYERKLLNP